MKYYKEVAFEMMGIYMFKTGNWSTNETMQNTVVLELP